MSRERGTMAFHEKADVIPLTAKKIHSPFFVGFVVIEVGCCVRVTDFLL